MKVLGETERCFVKQGRNEGRLTQFAELIKSQESKPHYAFGSVVMDPCGCSLKNTPYDELIAFAKTFPKMDIIMNINYRSAYRTGGLQDKKPWKIQMHRTGPKAGTPKETPEQNRQRQLKTVATSQKREEFYHPDKLLQHFRDKCWLISEPANKNTGNNFVVVVGRTQFAYNHQSDGFYKLNSSKGQEFMRRIKGEHHAKDQ